VTDESVRREPTEPHRTNEGAAVSEQDNERTDLMPQSSDSDDRRRASNVWPEGTWLHAMLYTDGTNHAVLIQPPHSGQIPPPHIGTMAYQGEVEWPYPPVADQ
jgi:hypothetical protein